MSPCESAVGAAVLLLIGWALWKWVQAALAMTREAAASRRVQQEVAEGIVARSLLPSRCFSRKDRVRALPHCHVDDEGQTGTVVDPRVWNDELRCRGVLVQFDSMPQYRLFMAGADLELLEEGVQDTHAQP